jgi:hypothetical protein
MARVLLIALTILLLGLVSDVIAYTSAWDESAPADSSPANLLGVDIRQFKRDIRERLQTCLNIGTPTDTGLPKFSTCWVLSGLDAAKPSSPNDGIFYFATDTNKLYVGHSGSWVYTGGATQFILVNGTQPWTGNQDLGGFKITGSGAPTGDNDVVRKKYVDDATVRTTLQHQIIDTGETTASLSFTDITTPGPSVTITVPSHGQVLVTITALILNNTLACGGGIGIAVSGANTIAPTVTNSLELVNGGNTVDLTHGSATFLYTGLVAGSTTFTAKYHALDCGTAFFEHRELIADPR